MTNLYETDFHAWANEQARRVRAGEQIDVENVAEELESLGRNERDAIESHLERILMHILKIRYQPGLHTRSWDLSIGESRHRVRKLFKQNPSLAARAGEIIVDAYASARWEAAKETNIALDVFPEECPYSTEDVLERDWTKD